MMRKALLLECDPHHTGAIRRDLIKLGFDVEVTVDGKDALDRLSVTTPDLLVVDLLHDGDGSCVVKPADALELARYLLRPGQVTVIAIGKLTDANKAIVDAVVPAAGKALSDSVQQVFAA